MKMTRRGFLSTGAAAAATYSTPQSDFAAAAVTESSGFATANGHKLYYATLGRGMPVIFMHGGLGFDHQYFRPFVDPLADAAQVVYYDHLGTRQVGSAGKLQRNHAGAPEFGLRCPGHRARLR